MARMGILGSLLLMALVLATPAAVRAETFDFDVSWTVHSTFSLANGSSGSADVRGQGPGRLTTGTAPNGERMFNELSFSDGKSSGFAGPLVNGRLIVDDSHPQFTTGLPADVEGASMQRPRNFTSFRINDDLTAFDADFTRQNECVTLQGCSGILSWQSNLTAHGTRHASVAAPEPASAALVVVGLALSVAARRRRR